MINSRIKKVENAKKIKAIKYKLDEMFDLISKQQEEIAELVDAVKLVYIANNTSNINGFNELMAIVAKHNKGE